MSTPQQESPWLVRWLATRFYFDVLDTKSLGKGGRPKDSELGYLLENVLPVPLESVHAVFRELGGGKFLACAIEREALQTDPSSDALVLVPDSIPEFLAAGSMHPDDLNLLEGDLAPTAVRMRRKRRHLAGLAVALGIAALLAVGMERRIQAAAVALNQTAVREQQTLEATLGVAPISVPSAQRKMALIAERRKLERTRLGDNSDLPDVSDALVAVLAAWPAGGGVRIDYLGVTDHAITIRGNADASMDAQSLADPLAAVAGFTVEQPQFSTSRGRVAFTLRLRKNGGGG